MHFLPKNRDKIICLIILIIGLGGNALLSQITYYAKATGNANSTATWTTNINGTGANPADFISGDIFIVRNGSSLTTNGTLTIDDAGIDNAGILRIATGGTLTATFAINFTSSSSTGTLFEIETNGRYVHAFGSNINNNILSATTTNFISGSTFEINTNGSHTNGVGASFANFTISNSAAVTFPSSILFISGILTINNGSTLRFSNPGATSGLSDAGAFSTAGTGLLRVNGSSNNVPIGVTWSFQVNYERTSVLLTTIQRIQAGTYSNLNATGLDKEILPGSIVTISGTFTPGAGTYTLGANSTFEFSSSSSITIPSLAYQNLTISGSGTKSISATTTVNGKLDITSGSALFDLNGNTLILNGDATLTTGRMIGTGLLRTSSTTASNLPAGLTWTFPVNYDAAGSQTVQSGTYTDLNTSGGSRTVLASAAINISGTFTPGVGTYTIGSTATFNYTSNGSLTIPILPYQNLTISGNGTKSISAPLTIAGNLNISNSSGFLNINSQTLTLNGDATLTNGKLIGSSTSNLTVSGASGSNASIGFSQSGTNNQLHTLTLNRTGGGEAILLDDINIINRLIITAGNLNTNNKVVGLISTGYLSTARVDQVTGSISYGSSGGVRVERYIPSGFRSYRDLTPSVQTFNGTILGNWQENGSSPVGYGTHITGVKGGAGVDLASGLDITQTGNGSMFTYDGTSFPAVTNTASTILDPYRGYRILIRGDRNVDLYTVPTPTTMNRATTLRATGKLIYGDVTYSTSGVSNSVYGSSYALTSSSSTGFSLIGNPYACPVSWSGVLSNTGTSNIQNTYWYFDPQQGINGIYKTVIKIGSSSNPNGSTFVASAGPGNAGDLIQPGQAFFIRNDNSTSPSIQFKESNKYVSSSALSVFSVPLIINNLINKLDITIEKTISSGRRLFLDGNTLVFSSDYSNNISNKEDAGKITNGSENLAIVNISNGTNLLSIESRKPVTEQDTIALRLWQMVNNDAYTLNVIPRSFSSNGRLPFLNDAYLKNQTFIRNDKDTIRINFTTLNTDSSSYYKRFSLVFKQPVALSNNTSNATLTGTSTGTAVGLNWKIANDNNQLYYELEKSTNSVEYTNIAKIYSDGSGNYTFIDTSNNLGKVYYRVRYYNTEAQYGITNTVLIEPSNKNSNISVYPNPVRGNTINIQMNQLEPGNYQLAIMDNLSRVITTQQISHQNNSSTLPVNFNRNFVNGLYRLKLTHLTSLKVYTTNIIFQSNQ